MKTHAELDAEIASERLAVTEQTRISAAQSPWNKRALPSGIVMLREHHHKNTGVRVVELTVPSFLACELDAGLLFRCELTEEGILFRYLDQVKSDPKPSWVQPVRKTTPVTP